MSNLKIYSKEINIVFKLKYDTKLKFKMFNKIIKNKIKINKWLLLLNYITVTNTRKLIHKLIVFINDSYVEIN
jgi:hypothetical protein